MPQKMSITEADEVLREQAVGRLGFRHNGRTYVMPINYGYDGKYIYAHSKDGMKIDAMRNDPNVCFEVDTWKEDGSWKSVIIWGRYEELNTVKSKAAGMQVFSRQMAHVIPSYRAMPSHGYVSGCFKERDPFKSVVFRILIEECTGMFENAEFVLEARAAIYQKYRQSYYPFG